MMEKLKSVLISAGALTLIAGVATAALAATNAFTEQRIAEIAAETADTARRHVISADTFEEATLTFEGDTITYHVASQDGVTVGYVFTAVTSGKSAGLTVMTGVSRDGVITGVTVTEDSETAGYIDKVQKGGLFAALTGRTDTEVKHVSQATKTSEGIKAGAKKALQYYQTIA